MEGYELWRFETANFTVVCDALPEDTDPADSFENPEDVEDIRRGVVDWFCARVRVLGPDDEELANEYLGGCAYRRADDFVTGHRDRDPMNRNCSLMRAARGGNVTICHYFPDMVKEAVAAARIELARRRDRYTAINLRA